MDALFTCKACGKNYPEVEPDYRMINGMKRFRPTCKCCDKKRRTQAGYKYDAEAKATYQKSLLKSKHPKVVCARVIHNCRGMDKRRGWTNDLTLETILPTYTGCCVYCGETDLPMGLDRINNDLPHNLCNVVWCCPRCNLTRRCMPYEAWVVIAKAMRVAREQGLFGKYAGGGMHKVIN